VLTNSRGGGGGRVRARGEAEPGEEGERGWEWVIVWESRRGKGRKRGGRNAVGKGRWRRGWAVRKTDS